MFLLDTNVISGLRRPDRLDPRLENWFTGVSGDVLFVSVITVLELQYGADLKAHRDVKQGAKLRNWIEGEVIPRFFERILPVDLAIARRTAALHVPDRRPERDAFIAATALVHGLTVVTRNMKDFRPLGVPVVDPWESGGA